MLHQRGLQDAAEVVNIYHRFPEILYHAAVSAKQKLLQQTQSVVGKVARLVLSAFAFVKPKCSLHEGIERDLARFAAILELLNFSIIWDR